MKPNWSEKHTSVKLQISTLGKFIFWVIWGLSLDLVLLYIMRWKKGQWSWQQLQTRDKMKALIWLLSIHISRQRNTNDTQVKDVKKRIQYNLCVFFLQIPFLEQIWDLRLERMTPLAWWLHFIGRDWGNIYSAVLMILRLGENWPPMTFLANTSSTNAQNVQIWNNSALV